MNNKLIHNPIPDRFTDEVGRITKRSFILERILPESEHNVKCFFPDGE